MEVVKSKGSGSSAWCPIHGADTISISAGIANNFMGERKTQLELWDHQHMSNN